MSIPSLSLSIFNGQIKAVGFRKGKQSGTWEAPEALLDLGGIGSVVGEAARFTGGDGRQVSIVLADPRLSDQVVEIPEVKGTTLRRLLNRKAEQIKAFPGEAVWSSQPALPTKKTNAVLMHLCPKEIHDRLARSCQEAHLQLVRLLPTTAVLVSHLKSLPLEKDELAMVAAETGRSTTIVIGTRDGRVCLGRVMPNTWITSPDRVWVDLARSIGFGEQQSGMAVTSVWLFGADAEGQVASAQAGLKVPVRLSPVPYTPTYWAEQAAKLPEKGDGNLISAAEREAPQRARFLTATGALTVLLMVGAIVAAFVIHKFRENELKSIKKLNGQIAELMIERLEWQQKFARLERMEKTIRLVRDEKLAPVPNWFLGYLGQVLPNELAVTRLKVTRTNDLWAVHMAGTAQVKTNVLQMFNTFSNTLATSSFRMAVTRCGLGEMEEFELAGNTRANLGQTLAREMTRRSTNTFVIHGLMR